MPADPSGLDWVLLYEEALSSARRSGARADAEDVAQQAVLFLLRDIQRVRDAERFVAGAARRLVVSLRRSERRRLEREQVYISTRQAVDTFPESRLLLQLWVRGLPDRERTMVELFREGLSVREIALRVDFSKSAVSRRMRALLSPAAAKGHWIRTLPEKPSS